MNKETVRETLLYSETGCGLHMVRVWIKYESTQQEEIKFFVENIDDYDASLRKVADLIASTFPDDVNAVEVRNPGLEGDWAELTYNDWP